METLNYLVERFNIDLSKPSPFEITNFGRYKDIPRMFKELGFKVGAEIGVFEGMFTERLMRYNPELMVYGIDLWEPYSGYKDFEDNTIKESYARAVARTENYDCELIKGWSHEVVKRFEDESLDFVFIDGNHAFEYVVADIANWSKKVRKDGIVCGHDYLDFSKGRKWRQMQVKPAVDAWMEAYKIHPWLLFAKHHVWMYVK